MLTSLLSTLVSRFSVAGLNFLLVILCARWFGAEGTGQINLLKADLALLTLLAGFSGVSSLSFLASRYPVKHLYSAALAGNAILSILGGILLYFYHPGLPDVFVVMLPVLVFLLGVIQIQQALLLGAGELQGQNTTGILLAASQLLFIILFIPQDTQNLLTDYAGILRFSYLVSLIFSLIWLGKVWNTGAPNTLIQTSKACYTYGFRAQLSNLVHFFNYRLTWYFLSEYSGNEALGVFSVGVSVAEAIWLISQSIATVQYMRVARSEKIEEMAAPTISFAWLSMGLAGFAAVSVLLLPAEIFIQIFSEEFRNSLSIIYWLLPGILAQSFSTQLAHYFAGRGMYGINLGGSLTGVLINILGGLLLIPIAGIKGAALTASAAYILIAVWQILFFKRISGLGWSAFLPFRTKPY